jgi:hypothetical protein
MISYPIFKFEKFGAVILFNWWLRKLFSSYKNLVYILNNFFFRFSFFVFRFQLLVLIHLDYNTNNSCDIQ